MEVGDEKPKGIEVMYGAQALYRAVQALAMLENREYAVPDDVKRLALAQRTGDISDRILEEILTQVDVPL